MIDFGFGVRLGPVDREHKDVMRRWRNDPRVSRWCRQDDVISDQDQDRWFERQSLDPTIRMYAVYARPALKDGMGELQFSGVAGLTSIDRLNRRAEFSLYVAPTMHQRGTGNAALRTLLAHAFVNLGLHVVWGECFEGNPAMKLFRKLGFTEEGVRRDFYYKQGRFIGAHLISITGAEWRQRSLSASRPS